MKLENISIQKKEDLFNLQLDFKLNSGIKMNGRVELKKGAGPLGIIASIAGLMREINNYEGKPERED